MTAAATTLAPLGWTPADAPDFGIYVHWPFCLSKCPYCDFNSHVREQVEQDRWRRALTAELAHYAERTGPREVTSLFFGGGTPSLMPPETVAEVIETVRRLWPVAGLLEVTLEANPGAVDAERFAGFAAAGVNRLSLGVQALDDDALGFLGRGHSVAEALTALELARRHFPRLSFDLIYARPGQSAADWQAELRQALTLGGDHLSLYQLTIEEGTAFHAAWRRGELIAMPDDDAAALYELTQDIAHAAGRPAYEVSNHAVPGSESRHNLTYWRYGDYVGVGPGAHGRLTLPRAGKRATRQHRAPEVWLARVERDGHATQGETAVDRSTQLAETIMMGLRLTEGIPRARLERIGGASMEELLPTAPLARLIDGGFLSLEADRLTATPAGRQRLNAVIGVLLAETTPGAETTLN